ncbi:MAG: YbaB/EbfC family nucleoid-associated protein [Chloroflexota bacterium]|nr:YbaB/EbfC family nucleoid-associated protein [Chloroflexota bacterium]
MDKKMIRQAQELQAKLLKAQEELANETVEGSAGGGAVTIVVDGQQRVHSVKISPDAIDPDDPGLLEDIVLAAINEALEKSQQLAQDRMGAVTGNAKLPGLF